MSSTVRRSGVTGRGIRRLMLRAAPGSSHATASVVFSQGRNPCSCPYETIRAIAAPSTTMS